LRGLLRRSVARLRQRFPRRLLEPIDEERRQLDVVRGDVDEAQAIGHAARMTTGPAWCYVQRERRLLIFLLRAPFRPMMKT